MQPNTQFRTVEPGLENTPSNSSKFTHAALCKPHLCLILLGIVYVACVVISNPCGEFPIGDDFIYNGAVKDSLASGTLKLNWSAQACYLHILLGAGICKLFGFSYLALRINNMFWTLFGTIGLYMALRTAGLSSVISTGFAAVYLFNPIIYWLSFTFMTDAMSLGLTNWFIYLSLLGLRNKSLLNLTQGSLVLMASLACRLFTAIYVLPGTIAVILCWRPGKRWWAVLALSLFGPLVMALGLPALFRLTDPGSASVSLATMGIDISSFLVLLSHHPIQTVWRILVAFGQLSIYLGVFCTPVMLSLIWLHLQRNLQILRFAWITATALITATLATLVGHNEKLMPFVSNVLYPPWTCIPAVMGFPSSWYHEVWAGLTAISSILGFTFIVVSADFAWRTIRSAIKQTRGVLAAGSVLAKRECFALSGLLVSFGFVSLVIVAHDNDRYYSMVLAPALVVLALVWRKFRLNRPDILVLFTLMAISIAVYSVASVHDCLSSFRARYLAIDDLEKSGIDPKRIDGGWEYDMMISGPELIKTMHPIPGGWKIALSDRGSAPLNSMRWWPVVSDEYVISQKEYDGYKVVKRYPYTNWVLQSKKEMLALQKISPPSTPTALSKVEKGR